MARTRPLLFIALSLLPWLFLIGLAAAVSADKLNDTVGQATSAGDSCKMKDGSLGVCRSIKQCNAALEALKRGETPIVCSYNQTIVCCPNGTRAPGAMAAAMCTKYAEAVYELVESPVLITSPPIYKRDNCAKEDVFGEGGVTPNEFPHLALLGFKSSDQPTWVCAVSDSPVVVRMGELDLKVDHEPNNQHVDYGVQESVLHPDYKANSFYNDVALLKLDRNVNFTRSIRPACLNALAEIPDESAIAAGWGYLEWADYDSGKPMKAKLPLLSSEECLRAYRTPTPRLKQGYHKESMLCAGDLAGGKDTCQGDSGGPLQTKLKDPYCMYSIIGITNFGKRCGAKNSPAVYARVSYFLPWIESMVWPN